MKYSLHKIEDVIKKLLLKYTENKSHTLSSDIKEFFATYALNIGYNAIYALPLRKEMKRTISTKNTNLGKKCFVFANGPSMELLDTGKIRKYQNMGYDVICINHYIISEMAKEVIPDYYVLSDPLSFYIPDYVEVSEDFAQSVKLVKNRLNDLNIPTFIPCQFYSFNLFAKCYIFNDFENRFTRNIDITKSRGYPSTTAFKALAVACHLGYDTIYMCGIDLDYFKTISVDENNNIYYVDKHYYDSGMKRKATPKNGEGIGNLLWDHYRLFKSLESFYNNNIINLNKNGLVDTFSKAHDLDIYR